MVPFDLNPRPACPHTACNGCEICSPLIKDPWSFRIVLTREPELPPVKKLPRDERAFYLDMKRAPSGPSRRRKV